MATRKPSTKTTKKKLTAKEEAAQKEKLIADLKETLKEAGRIPGLIFAPVVAFIAKKYDTIPKERRAWLDKVITKIKTEWKGWLDALRERFTSAKKKTQEVAKETKKQTKTTRRKPAAKKAPVKTTTRKTTTTTAKKPATKKTTTRKTTARKTTTKTKKAAS